MILGKCKYQGGIWLGKKNGNVEYTIVLEQGKTTQRKKMLREILYNYTDFYFLLNDCYNFGGSSPFKNSVKSMHGYYDICFIKQTIALEVNYLFQVCVDIWC